jgi:cysteine desulfurase / selenocysteine lyase
MFSFPLMHNGTHSHIASHNQLICGSEALRTLFPHSKTSIYLDHASIGPLSLRVRAALQAHLLARSEGAVNTFAQDLEYLKQCRKNLASLINAESPDRIAFFMNTSDALNVVPTGLQWSAGDRIVVNDLEFPANVYPYWNVKKYGVELDILPTRDGEVTPEMIEQAITGSGGRVRLVSLSAVQFLSGFRADLAAIGEVCKRHGVLFVVDAIQAAGAVPLDVQGMSIDALACGAQKWLLSTTGLAFLYISEELQHRIAQTNLGWISVAKPWDFFHYDQPLSATATRYENGTLNFPGVLALGASVQTFLEIGVSNIEQHLQTLTQQLMDGLTGNPAFTHVTDFSPERRAGIVSATLANTAGGDALCEKFLQRNITISLREGRLRFAPHCYNTTAEIAQTLDVVRDLTMAVV